MFDAKIADFAVHVLLQSTLLIVVGLLSVRICGRHKPAVQSVLLRVTLIAVLLCPFASLALSNIGVTSYALLPAWESQEFAQSESTSISQVANTLLPVADEKTVSRINNPNGMADTDRPPGTDISSTSLPLAKNKKPDLTASSITALKPLPNPGASNRSIPFVGWIVSLIWVTGAGILLVKLLLAYRQIAQLCRDSLPAKAEIQRLCRETAETLGLLPPDVKIAASVHSPCLIGIWKPVILLPEQKTLTEPVLRDIFLHELAHLARRDCLFHLLARLATAVLFFQPLAWRLSRRLELIADDLCDDYVIHFGACRKSYANTLVDFAEQLPSPPLATEAGLAMVSLRSSLSRRIMRIMDSSRSLTLRLPARWVVLIVLLGITATTSAALIVNARTGSDLEKTTTVSQPDKELTLAASPKAVPQTDPDNTPEKTVPNAVKKPKTVASTKEDFRFRGRVVDPHGKPAKQATISQVHWDKPTKRILATTDDQGKFDFSIPASDELYDLFQKGEGMYVAQAEGYGLAAKAAYECETSGKMREALLERNSKSYSLATMLEKARKRILNGSSTFQLVSGDFPLTGRVVNIDGQPVADAKLQVTQLMYQEGTGLDDWEKAAQTSGTDYYQLRSLLGKNLGNGIGGMTLEYLPTAVTNKNGQFILKGLGRDRIVRLLISGPGIATSYVYARTRAGKSIEVPMQSRDPSSEINVYYPNEFTHVAGPSLPVEGMVRDAKTQKPMPGVRLQSYHLAGHQVSGWSQSLVQTVTDDEGRYRLEGLPIGKNEVICLSPLDQPYLIHKFAAETKAGGPTLKKNVDLTRGIWVEGRAYDKDTGEPIEGGRVEYFAFNDNPYAQSVKKSLGHLTAHYRLQSDGTYRIPALPGRGIVTVMADVQGKYQRGSGAEKIKGKNEYMDLLSTEPYMLTPMNVHVLAEVNPAKDAKSIQLDFPFEAGRSLKIEVVDQNGTPVTGGRYSGMMEAFYTWRVFTGSQLEIKGYQPEKPRRVQVFHKERKLVGFLLLKGENTKDVKITLQPCAEITGRLIEKGGVPKANARIINDHLMFLNNQEEASLPPNINDQTQQTQSFVSDENGRFTIVGLMPGIKYNLVVRETRKNNITYDLGKITDLILKPGEVRDLGDVQLKPEGAE